MIIWLDLKWPVQIFILSVELPRKEYSANVGWRKLTRLYLWADCYLFMVLSFILLTSSFGLNIFFEDKWKSNDLSLKDGLAVWRSLEGKMGNKFY